MEKNSSENLAQELVDLNILNLNIFDLVDLDLLVNLDDLDLDDLDSYPLVRAPAPGRRRCQVTTVVWPPRFSSARAQRAQASTEILLERVFNG